MSFILHNSDCLDPITGLASLPDKSVDHVICDPPYEAEAHTLQRRTRRATIDDGDRVLSVEPLDFEPMKEADRVAVAGQMARIARRWILVFCQAEAVAAWHDSLVAAGATYKRSCVWVKPEGMPQLTGYRPEMGYVSFVAAHAPGKSRWNGGGQHGVFTVNKNDSTARVIRPRSRTRSWTSSCGCSPMPEKRCAIRLREAEPLVSRPCASVASSWDGSAIRSTTPSRRSA